MSDEQVRSWDSTQDLIEEFNHILTEKRVKLDNLANVDRDVVEEFLKEELCPSTPLLPKPSLSPVIPAPPQTGRSNEGPESSTSSGSKEDPESSVSDSTHKGESDGILATKKEVLVTLDWDSVDALLGEISRKEKDSESSVSIKKYLEEFNATLKEEFEKEVWTSGDNIPPPPSLRLRPPALPPNMFSALPVFSVDATVPVRHNEDQDNVFGPHIPTFLSSAPPPPSIQEIMEDVNRILGENFGNVFPTDWNVKEEVLPGNVLVLPPPPCPLVWLGPPQFHMDTLILHSLPVVHLPEGFKVEPIGVLNGEILYGLVPPPLNIGRRKQVRDKRDDGRPYIKKPPNAFMLYLKEVRPNVVSQLNINRSDMVNKVVGEMWNCLPFKVKVKYFEKARREQKLHQQRHPDWSTQDNYGKKKKKWEKNKRSSSSTAYAPQCPIGLTSNSTSEAAQDHQGPKAEAD